MVRPAARREIACVVQKEFHLSERRVCRLVKIHRTTKRYEPKSNDDSDVLQKIHEVIKENPRYGAPQVHRMLRRQGMGINHKRTTRIYSDAGLQLKHRPPKRKRRRPISELPRPAERMEKWSLDFVHDNLSNGRSIRTLTIIDEHSRESPMIEVDTSLSSLRVIQVLNRLKHTVGLPTEIGVDSGSEFTSHEFQNWAKQNGIGLDYCQPGKKNENAFIESFNARFRDECLNMHWFTTVDEAREIIEDWRNHYNTKRPHGSLGGLTPFEFANN